MIQRIDPAADADASEPAEDAAEAAILDAVQRLSAARPELTPVAAAVIAAIALGVCRDSRTFSRMFGISHAIVLREIAGLSQDQQLVEIIGRNERTQRTELALTEAGQALSASCVKSAPAGLLRRGSPQRSG